MTSHPDLSTAALTASDVTALRALFPILDRPAQPGAPSDAYLDWAATGQRPARVVEAERDFLFTQNAAVHRGASMMTGHATEAFEGARERVARFVGRSPDEIVWAENATDALNLVAGGIAEASAAFAGASAAEGPSAAASLGVPGSDRLAIGAGDEILVTEAEHHANLIPWQRLAARTGATLRFIPVREDGTWTLDDARAALNARTRVFAFGHVSNVTGYVAPVAELVALAQAHGTITVLDACQSVPHLPVDLGALGVDFAAFSGHKMLGPYGLGVLAGRAEMLAALPPARTGGSTITTVTMERAEFLPPPMRFEAGTQPVSQVIGLGAAVDLLDEVGMHRIAAHEHALVTRLVEGLSELPGVRLLGPSDPAKRVALTAIDIEGVHAHDAGQFLDEQGISVRVGHHCAQPLHRALGVTASVRASVHLTTTADEVDRFLAAVRGAQEYFGVLPAGAAHTAEVAR
ncbi:MULTISPECIES: aminotransferase class V-fold PLP-dependent enzyme [unclassified Leucobacter]|uniref:aminotransferase class V-fold PLP-dependent enzyme n=1 Tax=unclassified Leucobacter TaxID=2621730 RepID=UPI00165DBFFA|nr:MULTISPECIES: aminotransferase class V-fold PLP-dependent enzyme [unclassified Leucobacter]MBC9935803.1 aminotransferase class V-fold PLP-dependent enzyme [Leucobacter sp. cx-87]